MAESPLKTEPKDQACAGPLAAALAPDSGAIVVLCAIPADFDAESLATVLIERSLVACLQVGAGVTSIYRFKGVIEKSAERLLLIKTRAALYERVEAAIRARHPYEVPEIIAFKVSAGHAPYLAWLAAETAAD